MLGPRLQSSPAIRDVPVEDVTVVMPFYDRVQFLQHYVDEGFWDGLKVQLVCDGTTPDLVTAIRKSIENRQNMNVYSYLENKGVAFARSTGINIVRTPYLMFCDDDDFMRQARSFLTDSSAKWSARRDLLFTGMPSVYAFNEDLQVQLQYDRTPFHQKTGRELLSYLVRTGEMAVLTLGSVFATETLKGIEPESFFKVSEDYTLLVRLCARYPDRRVYIEEHGAYMRLVQTNSLSSRSSYSLEKLIMHLVSMFVGAFYLIQMGELRTPAFQQILLRRGDVLQRSYGSGASTARFMASLLGSSVREETDEFQQARIFLESHRNELPAEFCRMVGWSSNPVRLE